MKTTPWWTGAVIYQIYPRSFADADGDGVGDLKGITAHLDHVAALGVDAIWISPFFVSPMDDFGYDVADHRDVDPLFGSLDDFDALVAEAHARGLKVTIDLVLSHTSDRHPWFVASRASRQGPHADHYVWADPQPDGSPPNNWLSIFGGVAWQWDTGRRQYYLHNFLVSQPDLNFHHPEVQAEALDVARFWLERGVDGFRLDTVNYYFHDAALRSNPAATRGAEDYSTTRANPYAMQEHVFDKNRPESVPFIERFAAVLAEYDGMALGELGAARAKAPALMAEYTGPGRLPLCYSFDLLGPRFDPGYIAQVLDRYADAGDAVCWAFSNHDVIRTASRFCPDGGDRDAVARLAMALLTSLRGTLCLYQGEELGLPEAVIPREKLVDPYGIAFWPDFAGRDGCRTPMPWTPRTGLDGAEPWLPVPAEHRALSVDTQEDDGESLLALTRTLLARRRAEPALREGDMEVVERAGVLVLKRTAAGSSVIGVFNLSAMPTTWPILDKSMAYIIGSAKLSDGAVELPPWGWLWARSPTR